MADELKKCPLADELAEAVRWIFAGDNVAGAITHELSNGKRYVIHTYSMLEAEHARLKEMRQRLLPLAGIPDPAAFVQAARGMREALEPFARFVDKQTCTITMIWEDGDYRSHYTNTLKPEDFFNARAALTAFRAAMGEGQSDE